MKYSVRNIAQSLIDRVIKYEMETMKCIIVTIYLTFQCHKICLTQVQIDVLDMTLVN